MGVFFYYLPGIEPPHVTRKLLESRGIGDALSDCLRSDADFSRIITNRILRFSDGSDGTLLFADPVDGSVERVGFYPKEQTWVYVASSYWLGFNKEHPPTPEHLRRPTVQDGYEETLGDGKVWTCPIIRQAYIRPMLPQRYGLHNGEFTAEVLPEYAELWEKSADWFAGTMTMGELFEACRLCLSLNYRVSDEEITALDLLNDDSMGLIINAALDLPWFRDAANDAEKKRLQDMLELAGVSTSPGDEDSTPATEQAEPTSSSLHLGTEIEATVTS